MLLLLPWPGTMIVPSCEFPKFGVSSEAFLGDQSFLPAEIINCY
jgi:hypothetical protein